MPGKDGRGPTGEGPVSGSRGGRGGGGGRGMGQGGECFCSKCGTTVPHRAGTPCTQMKCPKCGSAMIRQ